MPFRGARIFVFLTGRGTDVDDIAVPGMLHAVIVRSPVARGRVRGIDARDALAMPGVVAVVTAADVGAKIPIIAIRAEHLKIAGFVHFLQPVIAKDEVRYAGEPVAVVLAESAALAEDGAQKVALDIEPLAPVIDRYKALLGPPFVVAAAGEQRDGAAARRPWQCGCRLRQCPLPAQAEIHDLAPQRGDAGAARASGRMGR